MYTLRIIDQTKNGAEKRVNYFLGKDYEITMKTPLKKTAPNEIPDNNVFNEALMGFYGEPVLVTDDNGIIESNIIGFVTGERTIPIRDYEVAYIVGSEGQTIERIYGIYNKY